MIALDTNVLARYVVADEPRQSAAARRLIESSCTNESPGVVSLVVLCELVWVLAQGYGYRRDQVAVVLRRLLAAQDLAVEKSDLAWQALNLYEDGPADFSDYVIGLSGRGEGPRPPARSTGARRRAACSGWCPRRPRPAAW